VRIGDVFRSLFRRQEKPQPNVPSAADFIGAIFYAEAERQAVEYETQTQFVQNDSLNIGTQSGVCFISFSKRK
jgi:hypothetical protein